MSDSILISADPELLDFDVIHTFLSTSYWSPSIPRNLVERATANSLSFGVYDRALARAPHHALPRQLGFARMITDRATFAYLADVFILPEFRGRGLSKRLMEFILAHPDLQGLRRLMLITRDAHGLYAQFGFTAPTRPEGIMEKKLVPDYLAHPDGPA